MGSELKKLASAILLCVVGLGSATSEAASAQENPPSICAQAKILLESRRFDLADAYAEQCYQLADASREVVIFGHYVRTIALIGLNKPKESLEQLEILMQPAYSESPIYDRRSVGLKYLGATQASIYADAARLSLILNDADKGWHYTEKALKLAAMDPATHIDVAGNVYMLRSRIRASRQDNRGAAIDLARAYIRGSQDPFVLENIKTFPAADQERLDALKARMLSAYSKYLNIFMRTGIVDFSTSDLNKLKAEGDPLFLAIVADEVTYLGPDT